MWVKKKIIEIQKCPTLLPRFPQQTKCFRFLPCCKPSETDLVFFPFIDDLPNHPERAVRDSKPCRGESVYPLYHSGLGYASRNSI